MSVPQLASVWLPSSEVSSSDVSLAGSVSLCDSFEEKKKTYKFRSS